MTALTTAKIFARGE